MQNCARRDLPELLVRKSPGFDFCGQCAAALQEDTRIESAKLSAPAKPAAVRVTAEQADTSELDGERKTVTPLFADIKGSTEMMEDLDPEKASSVIDALSSPSGRAATACSTFCSPIRDGTRVDS